MATHTLLGPKRCLWMMGYAHSRRIEGDPAVRSHGSVMKGSLKINRWEGVKWK